MSHAINTPPAFHIIGTTQETCFSLLPDERLRRGLAQLGLTHELSRDQAYQADAPILIFRADSVIDTPALQALVAAENLILTGSDGQKDLLIAAHTAPGQLEAVIASLANDRPPEATGPIRLVPAAKLGGSYWRALRKRETPYAMRLTTANRRPLEARMFKGAYKGVTDFVTKYVWPWPALHVTRACARLSISPNVVTALSGVFVGLAFYYFWHGHYLPGLISAWLMTFLDTVDGKLARVTLTSSKWGNIFDHGIDLIHPPFWYWAWAVGLAAAGQGYTDQTFNWVLAVIVGGYILQRIFEGIALAKFGMEIHVWRKFDSLFREITARRNPNMVILSLSCIFLRPDIGLILVALWTALCLAFHFIQLIHAYIIWHKEGLLTSWFDQVADLKESP